MQKGDYEQLLEDLRLALVQDGHSSFAILGITPVALDLVAFLRAVGCEGRLLGIYGDSSEDSSDGPYRSIAQLDQDSPDTVVVASDSEKERLLELAVPYLRPNVRIILAGYAHLQYRNPVFDEVVRTAAVPSLANGYPNSLVHLYQCLQNSARLGLKGIVAEFGIFKGGTTMLLSRFIERLGQSWRVMGFDTFAGFPTKRSVLDMYEHPDCVFRDEALVRRYLADRNIEIVSGDIVETVHRLESEDIVLAFVDTDNFTSASAVLDVIQDRVVLGGAVVFDHFTGRDRFRYTLGERIAAKRLLSDKRFFNLHDTGVFFRQC
jgi:O-methyltransferase